MKILPLAAEHADRIARLHVATLTGLLTQLGPAAARAFHAGCAASASATGFVALDGDALRGFVLGSARPADLRREVTRAKPVATAVGVGLGLLRRPAALAHLLRSFRGPDEGSYDADSAELIYLAVDPDARGSGVGRALVDAFTQAMRASGCAAYELSVDDDNRTGIVFYERLGFVEVGRYREFGIAHRRYRLVLTGP